MEWDSDGLGRTPPRNLTGNFVVGYGPGGNPNATHDDVSDRGSVFRRSGDERHDGSDPTIPPASR